ncbi:hypothetical protein QBC33DRAFT_528008 [Phialemonium atrogriseum]|uniref:Uncharacterized protein n=1 Tax=Phialemonium atrogriseum TaxID=1093897 RepID=A0AAJ0C7I8_9PEZI|nr:uncharacterized protein QBC33DRAFT_528008 [Phialemonium atrogriseum]KAK1770433.1 hypothetical protein QBC33DRAFT_528008 [Phialemonium atrogriseum]
MRNWLRSRFSTRPRAKSSPVDGAGSGSSGTKRGFFAAGAGLHRRGGGGGGGGGGDDEGASADRPDGSMREVAMATTRGSEADGGRGPGEVPATAAAAATPTAPVAPVAPVAPAAEAPRCSSDCEEFVEAEDRPAAQLTPPPALQDPAASGGVATSARESRFSEIIE